MTRKRYTELALFSLFGTVSLLVVGLTVCVLLFVIVQGFGRLSWGFISQMPENGGLAGGLLSSILGTLTLLLLSSLIAFPIGILSGIYVNEYAPDNTWKRFIRIMTSNLAGIPSVVFGLFGLAVFVKLCGFGPSLLAGSLTLSTLVLPIIIRTTEEALKQVDSSYRSASYALGASKWYTIQRVVLPAALPGIVSGLILGMGRIAGETAPIIFTVAASYMANLPASLLDQAMALPFTVYFMAVQHPDLDAARPVAYGAALVLLLIVLGFNLIARLIAYRSRNV
jgi:phosphate transport system permease protein